MLPYFLFVRQYILACSEHLAHITFQDFSKPRLFKMDVSIIHLSNTSPTCIKTVKYSPSGLVGRIVSINHRHYDGTKDRYKVLSETPTTLSVIRLQQDTYNPNKYYLTDEKNKFHGIIHKGALTKGRTVKVYETD